MAEPVIEPATPADLSVIIEVFRGVLDAGETYSYLSEEMSDEDLHNYWMGPKCHCMVVRDGGEVAGFYTIRPCYDGRAAHIANGSFVVHPAHQRRGHARRMGEHAIAKAKELGYSALQFNFVVSTNEVAVALWKSLGFDIVGTLERGFNHKRLGLVDVYIMRRFL